MEKSIMHSSLDRRRAGVLLHLTSLPGESPTGDLGANAYHFVDFLVSAGLTVWQMLPIGPTLEDGSPYQTISVHAGNPQLISVNCLIEIGLLDESFADKKKSREHCKAQALLEAWKRFRENPDFLGPDALNHFIRENRYWLDDYALFQALHEEARGAPWWEWPKTIREHQPQALAEARARLRRTIDYLCFEQFLFFRQWDGLKQYANERGVRLFGDMPIFVAHDSAEVWANQTLFCLDGQGHTTVVAGVPPDYFSETGQRWGNPLYRWDVMEKQQFSFWVDRLKTQLRLFDLIRVDHFRGFEAYWEIPATEEYAINGRWVTAPGDKLFDRLHDIYDPLPLVAEDLGIITPEVETLRDRYALPGMKILQFAFSGDSDNPYLPYQHPENAVVYTGTHDNNTTLGWYLELDDNSRHYVDEYLGYSREPMPWRLIRQAMSSRARYAIVPMQDFLALGKTYRMNLPGTTEGNWCWRFDWEQVDPDISERVRRLTQLYHR